jgi:hypothetical protein
VASGARNRPSDTKGGGGRRCTARQSLGLGQEDLGPKMSTGRMVELGAQFIGAK